MQNLGVFHRLGDLWVRVLEELEANGTAAVYTDNAGEEAEVKELFNLTAEIQGATLPDAIIEKHKVPSEYDWMVRNFTVQGEVPELHHQNSYASRLYSYMGKKDQIEWLIERLKGNPHTRSASITIVNDINYRA